MFKLFSKKRDINEVLEKITLISQSPSNPLEEHFEFSKLQREEFFLTNMLYCIMYVFSNKVVKRNNENGAKLVTFIYLQLKDKGMDMDYDNFIELAKFRNEIYLNEIGEVRATMLKPKRTFPKDYYSRLLDKPMSKDVIVDYSKYEKMDFSNESYLYGIYGVQINFLRKELEKSFK